MAATRKTATKKRAARKKAPAKKAETAKANGAHEPIEQVIKNEGLRYKLKALQLEWEREDVRVRTQLQQKINDLLARTQRNDMGWKRAADARKKAVNETIDQLTERLPEGYAITNVDLNTGTYRAVYDPDARGQHVS
jgi:hypothetical protein